MGKMKSVSVKLPKAASRKKVVAVSVAPKKKKASKAGSSSLLGTLGYGLGTYFGGPAGGVAGMAAGKLISKITGFGDYKVSKNSISMGNSVPTFSNGGRGMTVVHREFLRDVVGSVNFQNSTIPIQPGLVSSFPWVSLLAADFEEYDMEGLVYEFRPSSGSAVSASSSALGVVIMATDYDAANPSFTTKQQMESYEYSTSTVPFVAAMHPVECAKKLNVFTSQFVRTSGPAPNTDIRLYDMGNFQIATQGMQSAYTVGELWVSYHLVFRKPRLPPTLLLPAVTRIRENPIGSAASATPLGTTGAYIYSDSNLGITASGGNLFFTQPGIYAVAVAVTGSTAGGAINITGTPGANIVAGPNIYRGSSVGALSAQGGTSNAAVMLCYRVTNPGSSAANQLTFGFTTTANANVDIIVTLLSNPLPTLSNPFSDLSRLVEPLEEKYCSVEYAPPVFRCEHTTRL